MLFEQGEVDRQGGQGLGRAVMKFARDSPALLVLGVHQARGELPEGLFRAPALRDVAGHSLQGDGPSVAHDEPSAGLERYPAAVLGNDVHFIGGLPALSHFVTQHLGCPAHLVGRDNVGKVHPQSFPAAVAGYAFGSLVQVDDIPLKVCDVDQVARVLEQLTIPFLAFLQRLLRPLALGDVVDDGESADNRACSLGAAARIPDGGVVGFVKALAAHLQHPVRTIFRHHALARQRVQEEFVLSRFLQKRKNLKGAPTNRSFLADSEDAFHARVPDGVSTLAVKGEYSVDGAVNEALGEFLFAPQ